MAPSFQAQSCLNDWLQAYHGYVTGHIESFKADLFVTWSEENSEKLIIYCCVLSGVDNDSLRTVEEASCASLTTMLNPIGLCGIPGIQEVFVQ